MNFTDDLFRNGSNTESGTFGIYARPLAETCADAAEDDSLVAIALPGENFGGYAKPACEVHPGWYSSVRQHAFGYRGASGDMREFGVRDVHLNDPANANQTGFLNRFASTKKDTDNNTYYNFLAQKNDIPDLPADKPFGHASNPLTKRNGHGQEGISLTSVSKKYTKGFGYMPSGGFFKGYEL